MFWQPRSRRNVMAALRRAAKISGVEPVRIRQRSSSNVTSRTQWRRFSMPQWFRHQSSIGGAAATERGALVMAYSVSTSTFPWRRVVRVKRQTWAAPGQLICPTGRVLACKRRRTCRPCSLPLFSATSCDACRSISFAGGKSRRELGGDGCFQFGLIVFNDHEIMPAAVAGIRRAGKTSRRPSRRDP